VHLTRDERIAVIHDPMIDRTTDGTGPVCYLRGDELSCLDAGSWYAPEFAGERVPFLEEVLELTEGRARLNIELKGFEAELLAERVVELVRRHGAAQRVVVMSFDLDAALAARRFGREIPVLAIVGEQLEDQLGFVRSAGLSGLNQAPKRWDAATVAHFHDDGLLVHGSLINDPGGVEAFFALGGDMIDSDALACFDWA
jgi:glycerophosphoryl diester phosphodiesterase